MRSKNISPQVDKIKYHGKINTQKVNKLYKKQFQLFYRERDGSVQENPMESIIFMKSKRCKPFDKAKKSKVKDEFQKIMKDLDNHLKKHKNEEDIDKNQNKQLSSTKPFQLKSVKQVDQNFKTKKAVQRYQNSTGGKYFQHNKLKQKTNIENCKSPKKQDKKYLSPTKNITSPKTANKSRERNFCQNLNSNLSRKLKEPKTIRQTPQVNPVVKPSKNKKKTNVCENQHKQKQGLTKMNKHLIKSIPLKIQQYILVENDFQLVPNAKSISKLQTKLLSTYRNGNTQTFRYRQNFENYIFQNQQELSCTKNIVQSISESQIQSNRQEFHFLQQKTTEENEDKAQQFQQIKLNSVQHLIIKKIVIIQKWWKRIFHQSKQKSTQEHKSSHQLKLPVIQIPHFPSTESINFEATSQTKIQIAQQLSIKQKNLIQELDLIQKQKNIACDKKQTYKQILTRLLNEDKITIKDFNVKMSEIQKEYQKDIDQLKKLQRIINLDSFNQLQNKIKQDKKLEQTRAKDHYIIPQKNVQSLTQTKNICGTSTQNLQEQQIEQSQQQLNNTAIKEYKIGDRVTSEMQDFILTRKKTHGCHSSSQMSDKYIKKTTKEGNEYYEDFQQEHSPAHSPHKSFEQGVQQEQFFGEDDHGRICTIQPNTNYNQMLLEFKEQQQIKTEIEKRIAIQMGAYKQKTNSLALDTSIMGLHQFLTNFFKFYLYYYKDEFLKLINMPYGYQPEKRLKFIQGYEDQNQQLEEDQDGIIYGLQYIISQDILEEFFQQYYQSAEKNASQQQREVIQYAKIHNRVIFDCFNIALNSFRPYFCINGPPYTWNASQKALTFYFIAEENIQEVFQKTQFKVLKWASALLGLILNKQQNQDPTQPLKPICEEAQIDFNLQDLLSSYQHSAHSIVLQNRQERLNKQQKNEIVDSLFQWNNFEEQKTSVLYEISSIILEQLTFEMLKQINLSKI